MTAKGNLWQDNQGRLYMQECPKCGKENHPAAVDTGACVWCKYDANPPKIIIEKEPENGNQNSPNP